MCLTTRIDNLCVVPSSSRMKKSLWRVSPITEKFGEILVVPEVTREDSMRCLWLVGVKLRRGLRIFQRKMMERNFIVYKIPRTETKLQFVYQSLCDKKEEILFSPRSIMAILLFIIKCSWEVSTKYVNMLIMAPPGNGWWGGRGTETGIRRRRKGRNAEDEGKCFHYVNGNDNENFNKKYGDQERGHRGWSGGGGRKQ